MAELFASTFIFLFPVYLIIGILSIRFIIVKIIHPVFMFFVVNVFKLFKPQKKQIDLDLNCKTYELSREIKGLGIFFVCFSSFCLVAQEHGLRGPSETYIIFILSWAIFLFQIYKIELIDDKYLIFHRVVKNTKIEVKDITHGVEGFRFYRLYHTNGSVYLDHMIQGVESFKNIIQSLKPEINRVELSVKNIHKDWWGVGIIINFFMIGCILILLLYLFGSHIVKMFLNI